MGFSYVFIYTWILCYFSSVKSDAINFTVHPLTAKPCRIAIYDKNGCNFLKSLCLFDDVVLKQTDEVIYVNSKRF